MCGSDLTPTCANPVVPRDCSADRLAGRPFAPETAPPPLAITTGLASTPCPCKTPPTDRDVIMVQGSTKAAQDAYFVDAWAPNESLGVPIFFPRRGKAGLSTTYLRRGRLS